jgi:hypothetical protein
LVDQLPVSPLQTPPLPVRPPFPGLARFGIAVTSFGLLLDLVEHDLVSHINERSVAGFPLSEHAAHLVVLIGMVLVLIGIVRVGIRIGRPPLQQNRSSRHAIR